MKRFFGRLQGGDPYATGNDDADPDRLEDVLVIDSKRRGEYLFKYPPRTIAEHKLTVRHVREKAAEITGIPYAKLSLQCGGAYLEDEDEPIKKLGVEHGARIKCEELRNARPLGVPVNPHVKKQASAASMNSTRSSRRPETPRSNDTAAPKKIPVMPMEKIEAVRDEVIIKLVPLVNEYCEAPPDAADKREDMHRRLSETVMRELLKLDSVEIETSEERLRRKEVVKEIQGELDRLDRVLKGEV